jgi:hypothetical protein
VPPASVSFPCDVVVASEAVLGASEARVLEALLSAGVVVEVSGIGGAAVASVVTEVDDVASTWAEARRISKTLANPATMATRPMIPETAMMFVFINYELD